MEGQTREASVYDQGAPGPWGLLGWSSPHTLTLLPTLLPPELQESLLAVSVALGGTVLEPVWPLVRGMRGR